MRTERSHTEMIDPASLLARMIIMRIQVAILAEHFGIPEDSIRKYSRYLRKTGAMPQGTRQLNCNIRDLQIAYLAVFGSMFRSLFARESSASIEELSSVLRTITSHIASKVDFPYDTFNALFKRFSLRPANAMERLVVLVLGRFGRPDSELLVQTVIHEILSDKRAALLSTDLANEILYQVTANLLNGRWTTKLGEQDREELEKILATLNPHEVKVLKLLTGWDGEPVSIEEARHCLNPERSLSEYWTRQIAAKAVRKLRSPRRIRPLLDMLSQAASRKESCPICQERSFAEQEEAQRNWP